MMINETSLDNGLQPHTSKHTNDIRPTINLEMHNDEMNAQVYNALQMLTLRNSRSIDDMIFPSSGTAERLATTSSFFPVFAATIFGARFESDSSIAVRMIASPVLELRMTVRIDIVSKRRDLSLFSNDCLIIDDVKYL